MKMYLIIREQDEYDYYTSWPVAVTSNEAKAKTYVDDMNAVEAQKRRDKGRFSYEEIKVI